MPSDPKKPPHDVVTENPGTLTPVEWMLAVLRDPLCEQRRRDRMAEVCAPYLHARRAAVEVANTNTYRGEGVAGETINVVQIFAVPRGGSLDITAGTITIEGTPLEPMSIVEPYEPTPPIGQLTDQTQTAVCAPPEPLPVIEPDGDPTKLASLDAWRRKKTDE
jgi:hypothetical protein